MTNLKRIISGKRGKRNGAVFEERVLRASENQGWKALRIPDGCRQLGAFKIVRVKSPFDFIIAKDHVHMAQSPYESMVTRTILFDAKSTNDARFSPTKIKPHQIEWLNKFCMLRSYVAGYAVNFEKHGCVSFFTVPQLANAIKTRKGLAHGDGILLGNKFNLSFESVFNAKQLIALGDRT